MPLVETQPSVVTTNAALQSWTASLLDGVDEPRLLLTREIDDALKAKNLPANNPIPGASCLVASDGVRDERAVEAFERFEGKNGKAVIKVSDEELEELVWLNPAESAAAVSLLSSQLHSQYPEFTDRIKSNEEELLEELDVLAEKLKRDLSPWQGRMLICTRRDMKPWFDATGLEPRFVEDDPARTDDNQEFRDALARESERVALRVVVTNGRSRNPLLAEEAAELGLRVVSLDTFETGALTRDHYLDRMRHNAFILAFALSVAESPEN